MSLSRIKSAVLFAFALLLAGNLACAQGTAQNAPPSAVPALLLADIHFDPFHNPRLVPHLRAAPIERWPAILDRGNGLKADARLAQLEVACRSPRLDTDWYLLKTSLVAARDAEQHPVFVTLGGDLLTHQFSCRFQKLNPGSTPADLSAFAAKTVAFVSMELRLAFPNVPVYITLGNNDSGCADYRETAGSPFMSNAVGSLTRAAAQSAVQSASARAVATLLATVSPEGDYSVALPAPVQHGRLLVLQDIFDASWYSPCGSPGYTRVQEKQQIAWLRAQLTGARAHGENVWVMGHIPPGVDVYGSFTKYILRPKELCSAPENTLLADDALADTLMDFADIVRLGLFAHTHMDELRLLRRAAGKNDKGADVSAGTVPIKIVPSITSFYGNHPAFLVAAIDPQTMLLKDWRTVVSPDAGGSATPWPETYRYTAAYNLPDFSASSAAILADGFTSDPDGKSLRSAFFRDHFYAGGMGLYALGLQQIWPAYACAVRETRQDSFHNCLCPAASPPPPQN